MQLIWPRLLVALAPAGLAISAFVGPSRGAVVRRHRATNPGQNTEDANAGRVFTPEAAGEAFARCVAMPTVLPPSKMSSNWRMFFYGRASDEWTGGRPAFLPTGVSGYPKPNPTLTPKPDPDPDPDPNRKPGRV